MSINLRALANLATSAVNSNVSATVRVCTGWTDAPGARREPAYAEPAPVTIQLQALSRKDIEHLDSLNISNAVWSCFANMQLTPTDRKRQSGGDLLQFTDPATGTLDTWLVVAMLEGWPGWSRVALCKQLDVTT